MEDDIESLKAIWHDTDSIQPETVATGLALVTDHGNELT